MNLYSTLYLISMDLMFAFYCCVSSAKMSPLWSPNSHCSCWLTQNGKDDCVSAGSLCWIWVWCWNQFSWFFTLLFPSLPFMWIWTFFQVFPDVFLSHCVFSSSVKCLFCCCCCCCLAFLVFFLISFIFPCFCDDSDLCFYFCFCVPLKLSFSYFNNEVLIPISVRNLL